MAATYFIYGKKLWRCYNVDRHWILTIDLCLSAFPWAHFHSTKAAVKLHNYGVG
jgi:hypothetical protein